MAGDWIKVEKITPDKPEIKLIARGCGVSTGEAFTAWFRLWCWMDSNTEDGWFAVLTAADCDETSRLPGIGKALQSAQWIEFHDDGGAVIFNWDRHNGKSAKKRCQINRRVAELRNRNSSQV